MKILFVISEPSVMVSKPEPVISQPIAMNIETNTPVNGHEVVVTNNGLANGHSSEVKKDEKFTLIELDSQYTNEEYSEFMGKFMTLADQLLQGND